MTQADDAKEALAKTVVDWGEIADVTVEVFDVDEMPANVPGIVVDCGKEVNSSYRLVHMYVDKNGDWQLKWVQND